MLQVAIIGLGLIGTSLGMALRNADEKSAPLGETVIVGYDRNPKVVSDARGRLAIDRGVRTIDEAVSGAKLVVVAVPALAVREVFAAIAPRLDHGAVVTDVTSTKAQVLAWARELLPASAAFVGGHPMAGRERSGPAAADPQLFDGAIYCLTPDAQTRPEAVELVEAMVHQVGAKPYYIDPVEHDHYVAGVSHLPFVLSTLLVELTQRSPGWKEMAPLAATGYRDISRLASGDPAMHRDICLTNAAALTRWIDGLTTALSELRADLAAGDTDALMERFERARDQREAWLASRPGVRPGEDDFANISQAALERPSLFGRMFGTRGPQERKR
jgi:prephenate dehydrogenase